MRKYFKKIIIACLGIVLFTAVSAGAQPNAGSKWKSFDCSAGDEFNLSFGQYVVMIKPLDINLPAPNREDNLTMTIKKGNKTIVRHDFISSYGRGKVLIKSGYIFLEYGLGRGTGVREEYIKAYTLLAQYEYISDLVEIFEVQESYRFPPVKPIASPYSVGYNVRFVEDKDYLKVIFYGAEKGFGIPESKIIMLKKWLTSKSRRR